MSGTLGKISAILSLNTAQFQRGCSDSARDVRNFAGTIERNIRRASDSAQRSLGNILTPVQQLQASMRAAFSQQLSFRGFQGAIRDVETLKQRLASLDGRNVALVLNISGEQHIADLQQKLREINNRDIRILLRVGGEGGIDAGVRRLTQIRDELTQDSGFSTLQDQIAGVTARLNELNTAAATIKVGPKGGGLADLEANRQEVELLTRTLAELQQQRQRLVSQRVGLNIDFTELDELIAKTGRIDLTRVPTLIDRLGAAQQGQSETRLTRLTALAEGISRPLEAAVAEFSKLDLAVQAGFIPALSAAQNGTDALGNALRTAGDYGDDAFNRVERQVDRAIVSMKQMKELAESVSGLKTGNEMVFQQPDLMASLANARKFGERAAGSMTALGPSDRGDTIARLQLIKELGERAQIQNAELLNAQTPGSGISAGRTAEIRRELDATRQQIDAIREEGERVIPINVDTTEAKAKIDPIKESLLRIRELADFSFTGNVQSFQQAQAEVFRILAAYDRLGEASKARVEPAVAEMVGSFTSGNGSFDADAIKKTFELVNAEAMAEKGANDLREALGRIADGINPSRPIDVLKKTLDEARSAVAKLDPNLRAVGERNLARVEKYLRKQPGERSDRASDEAAIARAAGAAATIRDEAMAAAPPSGGPPKKSKDEYAAGSLTKLGPRYFSSAIGRDLDAVRSSVKNLGDTPLAGTLGPQLDTLKTKFGILTREAKLTADQVKQVNSISREAEAIRGAVTARRGGVKEFLSGAGGMGRAGLDLGIDRKALQGAASEIDLVQKKLSSMSREARVPVVEALERFRRANAKAFKDGSIATDEGKAKLEKYRKAVVNALSGASGVSSKKLAEELRRAGDVGRFGADKWSLGIQQLGFAIDDFMSSTGGFDQKIRAISNNLSQFAFIVGGTSGLMAAIGVTAAAQISMMFYKWMNGGIAAEAQAEALNKALEDQRRLVDEVADSFSRIGETLTKGVFSEGTRQAQEFSEELRKLRRQQQESRVAIQMVLDPAASRLTTEADAMKKEQEGASDRGQLLALTDAVQVARAQARAAAIKASREAVPFGNALSAVGGLPGGAGDLYKPRMLTALAANNPLVMRLNPFNRTESAEQTNRAMDAMTRAFGSNDPDAQIRAIERRMSQLRPMAQQGIGFESTIRGENAGIVLAANEYGELKRVLESLQREQTARTDETNVRALENAQKASTLVERSQALNANAVGGAPSQLRKELDAIGEKIRAALQGIEDARQEFKDSEGTNFDRESMTAAIEARERELAVLRDQAAAALAANSALDTFADTVKRISTDLADAVAGETRSLADKARRDENEARAALNVNGEFGPNGDRRRVGDAQRSADVALERRFEIEREARAAEDEAARVRNEAAAARRQFEANMAGDPQVQAERKRLEELQAVIDDKGASDEAKAKAAEEMAEIRRTASRRWEDSPQGRAFAAQADAVQTRQAENNERRRQEDAARDAARRGRDLGLAPGVKESREAEGGLRDIAAAGREGLLDWRQAQKQAKRFADEQMRGAAPAMFEMADAVTNAVLQGPSRQALNVTDVSTMEGSRELNRLLRGDDASKNANIVELEKQNQKLTELVTTMKDVAQKMGIVLEL